MVNNNYQNFSIKQFFTPFTTRNAVIIIATVGILVYCNALFNAFVWDDYSQIQNNNIIQSLSNIPQIFSGSIGNNLKTDYYRPLLYLSFSAIYTLFGAQPFFFHVFQVTIHIFNAIILYLLLNALFGKNEARTEEQEEREWNSLSGSQKIKYQRRYGAAVKISQVQKSKTNLLSLLLSLLYLVHPINVEAVAYISGLNDTLFFLFGVSALLLSLKDYISVKRAIAIGFLLLCSLLSKEPGLLFLLIILLFQFLFKRKRIFVLFLVGVAAVASYSFMRFAIGGVFFGKPPAIVPVPIASLSFLERLTNIPAIVLYYLTTMFFPLRLAVGQEWIITKITVQDFYLPLLLDSMFFTALGLGGAYIYTHKRNYFKTYLFFFLWFVSGLLLYLQIFPLDMTVADRWFYFPLIGILGMLGVGIQILLFSLNKQGNHLIKYEKAKMIAAVFGAVLILLFSVRTLVRNTNFHDEITLFAHDVQKQDDPAMEADLGVEYAKEGNMQAAFPHLQKSVNLYPYPGNLFSLGYWYENQRNLQEALEYYYKAFTVAETYYPADDKHNPLDQRIYIRLAGLLLLSNEYKAAEQVSKKGVQYFSDSDILWEELAVSESKLHNQSEALIAADNAKTLSPSELTNSLYASVLSKEDIQQEMTIKIMNQ